MRISAWSFAAACAVSLPVHAATVDVNFSQTVRGQQMAYGTNEISGHLLPSTVAVPRLAEINTHWCRYWVPGDTIRPVSSYWNWSVLDPAVDKILQAGALPMICFEGIPDWMASSPTGKALRNHPRDLQEWAEYCLAIVQHCAGRGLAVEDWLWEIWNEPNQSGFSVSEYLALYNAAAGRLRQVYPNLKIGGPSTAWVPQDWIIALLTGGNHMDFVTWHWYGAWDPSSVKPSSQYLAETVNFGTQAAVVRNLINAHRPGLLSICGELNLNSYCCPRDERIWEDVFIPYYASAMHHLLLNGADGEMIFLGTDYASTGYGLFYGVGPQAGLRSPGYLGKRLFSTAAPRGSTVVQSSVSGSSTLEALATIASDGTYRVILIHKTTGVTPVQVQVSGVAPSGGTWVTVDQASYDTGAYREEASAPGEPFTATLAGYALTVLELCTSGTVCDIDRDGFVDAEDNCPSIGNPEQEDGDEDGVGDVCDNCASIANADQGDADHDAAGDVCDACPGFDDRDDEDSDGVPDGCDACPETAAGLAVLANGCPTPHADFDRDGDVDMEDFGHFQVCLTGPGSPQIRPDCVDARLDGDVDVDQEDFGVFQRCLSGAHRPADVACETGSV